MSKFKKRTLEIFEMMLANQQKIIALLEGRQEPDMDDPKNWLNAVETLKLLPVCIRTLFTLRVNKEITWRKKGRYYEYFKPSIFEIRKKHLK